MTTLKRFAFSLAFAAIIPLAARAQTPRLDGVNLTPESGRVRVSAVGEVFDLKIEVVDESGETIFEGRQAVGRPLDWEMRDARGARVPPGTYTVMVSYATQAGKQRKRIEQIIVAEEVTAPGVVAGGGNSRGREAEATAQAASSPTPTAVGNITGEGTGGRISKFTGPNVIGNSVIAEQGGKIGIGTVAPGSKLSVVGGGTSVISAVNNVTSDAAGVGILGTGAAGSSGQFAYSGGDGVVGQGGNAGNFTSTDGSLPADGGDGIVGTGGQGAVDSSGFPAGSGGTGVRGIGGSPFGIGVSGRSENGIGVSGVSVDHTGVSGRSTNGTGVLGSTSSAGGFAGRFEGKVEIKGSTSILNGSANSPNGTLSFGATTRQMINLYNQTYGIGVQSNTHYSRTASGFNWYKGGVHNNAVNSPGTGGTSLMRLDANGNLYTKGAVNPVSDRNAKANFSSINPRSILDRLASIPIQSWSYKAEGGGVRHIGPVAQDFRDAFRLGADDKHISTVDADGVALASIQALYRMMLEKEKQIEALTRQVERQQAQLNRVRRTLRRGRAGKR